MTGSVEETSKGTALSVMRSTLGSVTEEEAERRIHRDLRARTFTWSPAGFIGPGSRGLLWYTHTTNTHRHDRFIVLFMSPLCFYLHQAGCVLTRVCLFVDVRADFKVTRSQESQGETSGAAAVYFGLVEVWTIWGLFLPYCPFLTYLLRTFPSHTHRLLNMFQCLNQCLLLSCLYTVWCLAAFQVFI